MAAHIREDGKKNDGIVWSLDALKLVLAIVVLLRHCGQAFLEPSDLFYQVITNTLSPVCVPVFFFVSGFLFFRKKRGVVGLKRQIWRILRLYLVWTAIYLPLIIIRDWLKSDTVPLDLVYGFLRSFLFSGSYYHLWYLPSLIVALLLVYLLSKVMNSQLLVGLGALLYLFGTLVDTYDMFLDCTAVEAYLAFFMTTRNGVFYGFLFVAAGKLIADKEQALLTINTSALLLILAIGIVGMAVEGWVLCDVLEKSIVNMGIAAAIVSILLSTLAIKFPGQQFKLDGAMLRNMSTVIYCCHPWFIALIKLLSTKVLLSSFAFELIAVLTLSGAISYGCCRLSKRYDRFKLLM